MKARYRVDFEVGHEVYGWQGLQNVRPKAFVTIESDDTEIIETLANMIQAVEKDRGW